MSTYLADALDDPTPCNCHKCQEVREEVYAQAHAAGQKAATRAFGKIGNMLKALKAARTKDAA